MKRVQDALVLQQICNYSPDFRNFDHRNAIAKHQVFGFVFLQPQPNHCFFIPAFCGCHDGSKNTVVISTQVGLHESDYVAYLSVHMR